MVGTQQVGEHARLTKMGQGFKRLAFLVDHILLASTYYLSESLYQPT